MIASTQIENKNEGLIRRLGVFDSSMIVIGVVVGSGIFMTSGLMAESLPSPSLLLLAWIVGGLHALAGGLTYAELGAAIPKAGGQYIYLREAFGRLPAFLFGWVSFSVYLTGAIAAVAVAFSAYASTFFPSISPNNIIITSPITISAGQVIAVVMILLFSAVNYIGLGVGKTIQNVITVIKIASIIIFVIAGLAVGTETPDFRLSFQFDGFSSMITAFGGGLVAVFWTFGGWEYVTAVGGEIQNPQRNLPRALLIGTATATVLYLLLNIVYLRALPIKEMAGVVTIGETVANVLFGSLGGRFMVVAIIISVLGALNGAILTGPRVYYAMAQDGLFFKRAAEIHPRYRTPAKAIVYQAVWASILTLSGTFEQLITFVVVVNLILWIAGAAAVFALRKNRPELPKPYKTWGYPWTPALFIIFSIFFVLAALLDAPLEALAGIGLMLLGLPIYFYWNRSNNDS